MAKIILTQEVTGLGAAGDIVTVKNGYARNYLLPRGFAVSWTVGGEKQVESIRAARAARAKASLEEAQETAAKLSARPIVVAHKAGADGRLFGSVKADAIADAIEEAGLGTIDQRTDWDATPFSYVEQLFVLTREVRGRGGVCFT